MKKLFISLLMIAATLNLMAQQEEYTSYAKLLLTGGTTTVDMTVAEGTQENFVDLTTDGVVYLAMYSVYNSAKYQRLTLNGELGELPIGFKAKADLTEYTISVKKVQGSKTLYLKDLQEDVVMALTADMTPYAFTIADNQKDQYIENRFQLYVAPAPEVPYTRDVAGGQWGTICYPASITEVQGGVLYNLTAKTETEVYGEIVTLPTVAGQPYVFQAAAEATQLVMPHTGDDAQAPVSVTGLVGTFEDLEGGVPAGAYGILNSSIVEIVEGNPLKANRAYIVLSELPNHVAGAPGRAIFKIANTPTNLDEVAAGMADGTYMINGQVVIVKDGKGTSVLGLGL
ncbi:MAG: hypothetical protein MJZ64_06130 [Paludibacteraceae bacterium]|nr:hypothetical protein [Paludibacteraceae bacterium]